MNKVAYITIYAYAVYNRITGGYRNCSTLVHNEIRKINFGRVAEKYKNYNQGSIVTIYNPP